MARTSRELFRTVDEFPEYEIGSAGTVRNLRTGRYPAITLSNGRPPEIIVRFETKNKHGNRKYETLNIVELMRTHWPEVSFVPSKIRHTVIKDEDSEN